MKTLFYDIRDFEFNYLLDKIPFQIEPYFIKNPLNKNCFINDDYLDSEAISAFVGSSLDSEVLEKFPNLKYIFLRCVGYSNVDLNYCKNKGIKVFNTPNYGNSTVAEYVFALLLALSKKLIKANLMVKDGGINQDEIIGVELCQKTLGVIGAGAIGRKVINIAQGFNMDVLVYDVNPAGAYSFVELDELYEKSDFISINCPLTDSTRGLINKEAFEKMKNSVLLINAARGEIIDSKELYLALINGKIKGAALDVVECEETLCKSWGFCNQNDIFKDVCLKKYFFIQKLMHLDNVIITPHSAYNTQEAQKRILDITLENINSIFDINASTNNLVLI